MDDAERIPIDIGYDVAAEAAASDPRTTVREDGTIVIDILAPQPCAPEPATGEEIVVCAVADDEARYLPGNLPPPPSTTAMQEVSEALSVKDGNLQAGLISQGQVGVRLKF